MSIKIGITGGIGSGKTVVSKLLAIMGVPVYNSDMEAKKLTVSDTYIREHLIALLGKEIYSANNALNKKLLADYLFSDPDHARIVNSIIHPWVKQDFRLWTQSYPNSLIVAMEAAILIEAGFAGEVDKIVMVYAPTDVRVERTIKRDSTTREAVIKRVDAQMDDEEKRKIADYVIINDGTTPLIPQVNKLILSLLSLQTS